jgi:hypothetical protein
LWITAGDQEAAGEEQSVAGGIPEPSAAGKQTSHHTDSNGTGEQCKPQESLALSDESISELVEADVAKSANLRVLGTNEARKSVDLPQKRTE